MTEGRIVVGIMAILLLVLTPFVSDNAVSAAGNLRHFKRGDLMPDISLPVLGSTERVSFSPGNGRPTALLFFSIRPDFRKKRSLALLAALEDLAGDLGNRASVLAIYSDNKKADAVLEYMKQSSIRLQVLDDSRKKVYGSYGVFMMPLVIILDGKGALHEVIPYTYNIRQLVEGNLRVLLGDWNAEKLRQLLEPEKKKELSREEKEFLRRMNYGKVMVSRKMYGKAVREFTIAVQLRPRAVEGFVELGFARLALKQYRKAEATFRKALSLDSESDDGIAGLGLALYGQGKVDAALVELENAIIAPMPRLEVIITLADIHEKKGNIQRAMRLNKLAVSRLLSMYEHRWQDKKGE